ncbi:MAG: hypothetical protein ACRYFX_00965 [Janthinobacterium lividum]
MEFPLQAYVAALGGLVFGREAINPLFRGLDVAVGVLGFWYLFRLVYERTGSFVRALVPGAFLLSSPTYTGYVASCLPDPVSLSLTFVGYYYWLRYFRQGRFRSLAVALGVLTLAGLIKTTSALHLGSVVGITLEWTYLEPTLLTPRQRGWLLGLVAGAFGAIGPFIQHNSYLNNTYQSPLFLATTLPITDPEKNHEIWGTLYQGWLLEYATYLMYWTLIGSVLLILAFGRHLVQQAHLPLVLLALAAVAIGWLFFQLMGAQFEVHDYYAICSFGPAAVLIVVLAMLGLGSLSGRARLVVNLGLSVLLAFLLGSGYQRVARRFSDDYEPFSPYAYTWLRGGAAQFRQLQVPATARLLVFDEGAPNLSLVYFEHRGLNWDVNFRGSYDRQTLLRRMAADSLTYLVMPPATCARLGPAQTELRNDFDLLGQQPAVVMRRRDLQYPW